MSKDLLVNGKAVPASTKSTLVIEEFLMEYYRFRQNILNGKVEFSTKMNNGEFGPFETLTQKSLNTIILRAKEDAGDEMKNPQADIKLYVTSDLVPKFDPIADYLNSLPKWDGHNYVADLFGRIPGITSEQAAFLAKWIRSAVAHWLQMDTLHANEVVPTFIGAQGCGKTTFLRRLLPEHLRQYYLDHLNLSNKFDKEMALTNNLLVNLDELEAIRPSQQASLKQTLSKNKVNGRPIFGCVQEDRARYASFVSTTNNPHPLTDATGSRRYICMQIPDGKFIDNDGDINYEQLYAQVLYELRELNAPYWFDNDEVARIQDLNQNYLEQKDMACLVEACFRKPEEDEHAETMNSTEMLKVIRHAYPSLVINRTAKVNLKATMKELNFDIVSHAHVDYYKVVPKKSA
jgi:predicted P-loop ATPase